MATEQPTRKPYPSDLTDAQWTILEPLLPAAHTPRGGRPREVDLREVVNTILSLNRSGGQWDMAAQEHRVRLLCAVARRRYVGHAAECLASIDPPASGSGAHAQCRVHRQPIGQDDGDGRSRARL